MRLLTTAVLLLVLNVTVHAQGLDGTYTIAGNKGAIVLKLQSAEGGIVGSLNGGTLNLTLKGFPTEGGAFLGAANDAEGEFASYFLVSREGNQVFFDIIEANEDGDPDMNQKNRITFAAGPAGSGGASAPAKAGPSLERARQLALGNKAGSAAKAPAAKPRPAARPAAAQPKTKSAAKPARQVNANAGRLPAGGPSAGGANWKTFRHATGLSMRYPANWKLERQEGFAFLIPPDQGKDASGPLEAYIVAGQGSEGVQSIEDPRVIDYLDQQMAGFAPFLQRQGEPERIQAATSPGIVASWSGTNPNGKLINAQVYATIVKGFSMSLITVGEPARLKKRNNIVRSVFASFAAGSGKRDPRIAGSWRFYSYKSSADGKFGTEKNRYMRLSPDGSASWSSSSESSGNFAGRDGGGNTTWTGGVAGQSGSGDHGTWSAEGGELFILWNDGSTSSWNYRVQGGNGGRKLYLKGSNAEADEWTETR